MSLPRFELGTSALSERHSNLAELQAHRIDYIFRFIRVFILLVALELSFHHLKSTLKLGDLY